MQYDQELVAGKLRRWEGYLNNYRLPLWDDIPNFGLYMEQVIELLKGYLDYLPPELKEEQFLTAATINNYVRKKVIPQPEKKRYYRTHIAYLIIICTMKHALSIPTVQTMLPNELPEDQLEQIYNAYAKRHRLVAEYYVKMMRELSSEILNHDDAGAFAVKDTTELIYSTAIISGFSRLTAEKLLLLEGKDLTNGGSISVRGKKRSEEQE